jgi:hypothetical protein
VAGSAKTDKKGGLEVCPWSLRASDYLVDVAGEVSASLGVGLAVRLSVELLDAEFST